MGTDEAKHRILPGRIRLLAVVAGCLSAVAGSSGMGPGFAIYSGILVLGAAAQPGFPRSGRVLTYIGALILSVVILPYGAGIVFTVVRLFTRPPPFRCRATLVHPGQPGQIRLLRKKISAVAAEVTCETRWRLLEWLLTRLILSHLHRAKAYP